MIDNFSWIIVYPEIMLLIMACLICLYDLSVKSVWRSTTHGLTLLTLVAVGGFEAMYALDPTRFIGYGFDRMVVIDPMVSWLKCFACIALFVTLVYARPYSVARGMTQRGGELYSLSLFALLGMFIMISGNNFLVLYLGLELLTLSSYALVALRRDHGVSTEAAMKYFVLGALASGFLLYGMSMLYGATGTLDITSISRIVLGSQVNHQVLVFGLVFVVAGLAFKLGAAPFHMWVPDVYQGAPTAVTLLIGAAPKFAAFALTIRLLVEGLPLLAFDWQQMLMVLAAASLLLGNLAGVMQTNIKRMLAYSTIAQMGFVLLGLIPGVLAGGGSVQTLHAANAYSSAMFYVVTYVLTTLGTFGVILLLSREGFESEEIADFAGLNQRSPLYAGVMTLCLFSLAGIPPLMGFYAKLSVLQALIATNQVMHIALAVFAVIMSLIGAFYYIRVIKVMYFDQPLTATTVSAPLDVRAMLGINALALVLLGLMPAGLMQLCADAIIGALGN